MAEAKAAFVKQIAVSEFTENRRSAYPDRFCIEGDPAKPDEFSDVEDNTAIAIYELKEVRTFRRGASLEKQ